MRSDDPVQPRNVRFLSEKMVNLLISSGIQWVFFVCFYSCFFPGGGCSSATAERGIERKKSFLRQKVCTHFWNERVSRMCIFMPTRLDFICKD